MRSIPLFGTYIYDAETSGMIDFINETIEDGARVSISYATFHTLNLLCNDHALKSIFNKFSNIHQDGIGVYIGTRILFCEQGLRNKFTGSDLYPILIQTAVQKLWTIFFFGDKIEILKQITIKNPELEIVGLIGGFNYSTQDVIKKINDSAPDILIVGLGQPEQEKWIHENKDRLNVSVLIAVGDGIKVFAGLKHRGSKFIQKIGLEWLVRLVYNPKLYWKRYLVGIPLFIFRVIKERLKKND